MKKSLWHCLTLSVLALACLQTAQAQRDEPLPEPPYGLVPASFTQQELDAMLAPIALYPDALLAQILMAATYPQEVAEAARWSRAIPGIPPQEAVRSVAQRNWDPSVQSLMAFPQVLQMMERAPDWTQRLGNAFLSQQAQVWNTVQALRQRADAAGQLRSSEQLRVLHNGSLIVLEPANPEVVYVPYYDPLVVYGRWWWPGYAPMRWDPWPGYATRPGWGSGFYVGSGIAVGLGFFFGQIDWASHRATVLPPPQRQDRHERPWQRGQDWQHDPQHRGGVPYFSPPVRPQTPPRTALPQPRPEAREHPPRARVEPAPATSQKPAEPGQRPPGRSSPTADQQIKTAPGAAPTATGAAARPAAPAAPRQAVPGERQPDAAPPAARQGREVGARSAPREAERSAARPPAPDEARSPREGRAEDRPTREGGARGEDRDRPDARSGGRGN